MPALLTWAVKNKIITIWERGECDYYKMTRDFLSHPINGSTDMPGAALSAILGVSQLVNKIFHVAKTLHGGEV
jgi:hypothetical protein